MQVATIGFTSYQESINNILEKIGARKILRKQKNILIKPNLINAEPHPITTPSECCEAVIEYIRSHSKANIIVGEGCGDSTRETVEIFEILGYREMAKQQNISLIDLNYAPLEKFENRSCTVFPEMYLPKIARTHYIISLPVLKAHSLAGITGAMKNMMGIAPPKYYSGGYGVWKKAVFHRNMHQSIVELNRYLSPDLSIMDASIGLANYHLGGPHCSPPVNKILAGYDAREVDRKAAELLGFRWQEIPHLRDRS